LTDHLQVIKSADAETIISAAFPEFDGMPVALLGEGWDFRLFEVGERWLFRFPKREGSIAKLEMERELLDGLEEHVPLPVPRYEYNGRAPAPYDRPFAGYRKLPGVPGDQAQVIDRPLAAKQMGGFLDALHSYPLEIARPAGVPEIGVMVAHWRKRAFKGLASIRGFEATTHQARDYLENQSPPAFEGTPVLVHNDLWPEHVLIDPRNGGLVGVIDWGDTCIGDPAADFAGLFTWYGEAWMGRVLASYPDAGDHDLAWRARTLAVCIAIHSMALGQAGDRPEWVSAGEQVLLNALRT
jgi:aminoglycoside phosphotransferase (APT) family kinase protein